LLVEMENLSGAVKFLGKVNSFDYYSKLDLLLLTSISEAQPLVVLEAQACGIPVVATDVGSCRELLGGASPDDRLLGPSGIVTPTCNPEATAQAAIRILRDPHLRRTMGASGRERVETFYQQKDFVAHYRELYAKYMEEVRWEKQISNSKITNIK
jgi:polysaccharide biosynthesis protein PelF